MSPCFIRELTSDGLRPVEYEADSLADAAQYEPDDGVYTVTNTYRKTKTLKLDAHLDRLEDSAKQAGFALKLNRPRLRAALRDMIETADYGDVRFRVTVPRQQPDHLILSLEPFTPISPDLIENGVRCISVPNSARQDATVKSTDWMHNRKRISDTLPEGIYDAILQDADGNLMEGLAANFYAILDGELRTADEGVLKGIAQQIVFEVAQGVVPVWLATVNVKDVPRLQEAFITSSSRGIVPVVEIDGHSLGEPGEVTRTLRQRYDAWFSAHLQEL